jgi:hypothetical protein
MIDTIVTAVEEVETYTPDGCASTLTRNFTPDHYITGIKALCDLHKPIIVYCNPKIEQLICENLQGKVDRLPIFKNKSTREIHPLYKEILNYSKKIVDTNPTGVYCWNPMITTAKLFFMLDAISLDTKNVLWVDAGLCNESYIPEDLGGAWHDIKMQDWNKMYPKNKDAVFNPQLGKQLFDLLGSTDGFITGIPYIGIEPGKFIENYWDKKIPYWSASPCIIGFVKEKLERIKDSYISAIKHYIDNYDRIFTDIEIFTFLNVYFDFSKLNFSKFDPTPDEGTIHHTLKNNIKHDKIRFNHTYIRK